eukprot:c10585_g1_i2.p1 GENE.c10585_g1_i2~~c10585_g1_i2.p1  ORF type:complete len:235 (+),score=78.51 c10585_g1_i2:122-826(+)
MFVHRSLIFTVLCRIFVLFYEPIVQPQTQTLERSIAQLFVRLANFGFLFTFFLILSLWAAIYRHVKARLLNVHRRIQYTNLFTLTVSYSAIVGIIVTWGAISRYFISADSNHLVQQIIWGLIGVLNFICSLGFVFYGTGLLIVAWNLPKETRRSNRVLGQLIRLTSVCSVCFLVRAGLEIFQVESPDSNNVQAQASYFAFGEILPILCVVIGSKLQITGQRQLALSETLLGDQS